MWKDLWKKFSIPLQGAQANCDKIKEEMQPLLQYAVHFISLSMLDYRAVWWRLFNAPSSSEWSNALILVELLLSLPASNGKLEQVFSQLNVIKTNKRTSLTNESLDDLLLLSSDCVPLKDFNPDNAIDLWWKDRVRRPHQSSRRVYTKRALSSNLPDGEGTGSSSQTESEENSDDNTDGDLLGDWDDWMCKLILLYIFGDAHNNSNVTILCQ